jgi:hypothetical protein
MEINNNYLYKDSGSSTGLKGQTPKPVSVFYKIQHFFPSCQQLSKRVISLIEQKGSQESRMLSRMVLNHPSTETKQLVKTLFMNFGLLLKKYDLDAKDLDFLLEAVPDARSSFGWKHTSDKNERLKKLETLIDRLKNFDQVADFDAKFSQYASDLDTITTAIGYRSIGPGWVINTENPSPQMNNFLSDFRKGNYLIPALGEKEFPNRSREDAMYQQSGHIIEIPTGLQDEVEGGLKGPQPGLPPRFFTIDSYVAKAIQSGVEMRAHTSGSAPLSLAAMQFLQNLGKAKTEPLETDLLIMAGLLCATYQLGDFHTLAETTAGVSHYYQTNVEPVDFTNEIIEKLQDIPARTFLGLAIGFLRACVDETAQDEFTAVSQGVLEPAN